MQHTAAAALGAPLAAVAAPRRSVVSCLPHRAAPRRRAALRVRAAAEGDAADAPSTPLQLSRRDALSLAAAPAAAALSPTAPAFAAGRGKAKTLPDEAYSALPVRRACGGAAAGGAPATQRLVSPSHRALMRGALRCARSPSTGAAPSTPGCASPRSASASLWRTARF